MSIELGKFFDKFLSKKMTKLAYKQTRKYLTEDMRHVFSSINGRGEILRKTVAEKMPELK